MEISFQTLPIHHHSHPPTEYYLSYAAIKALTNKQITNIKMSALQVPVQSVKFVSALVFMIAVIIQLLVFCWYSEELSIQVQ